MGHPVQITSCDSANSFNKISLMEELVDMKNIRFYTDIFSLFQILLVLSILVNELMQALAKPITAKGCNGNTIEIGHPSKKLQNILNNYRVVINTPPTSLTKDNVYAIKPSVRCPFKVEVLSPVANRIPSFIPRATCKNCPPKCKKVEIKKPTLIRNCNSEFGKVYRLTEEKIVIGYVYQR